MSQPRLPRLADLQVLEKRIKTLETCTHSVPLQPSTVLGFSDAMSRQFKIIEADHNTLNDDIKYNTTKQSTINKKHETKFEEVDRTLEALQSTIARLQLAPMAPLAPRPDSRQIASAPRSSDVESICRVRSRSRSQEHRRSRPHTDPSPCITMGPIRANDSASPRQMFELYMDTHLPNYALPARDQCTMSLDPTDVNYLCISASTADIRELKTAWKNKVGDGKVKMFSSDDSAMAGHRLSYGDSMHGTYTGYGTYSASGSNAGGPSGSSGMDKSRDGHGRC
ncbi:hypothetical protein C8R43DRAFT_1120702 [Mycena crocata]|nr:hypothetical protein C8R43DRAFT_1120702 [Mycena crocata]